MKHKSTHKKNALIQSLITFGGLFAVVVLMSVYYDFGNIDLAKLLFLVAVLCCVFIAKNVYDVTEMHDRAVSLPSQNALGISSEELAIQLYKNSPIPYILLTKSGEIRSANIAAVRLLGVSQSTVKEVNVFSVIEAPDTDHLDFLIEKYHRQIAVSDEVVQVLRPDEVETWALLSLFSFTDSAGERVGLLTLVDITKQKKAEEAKSEFVSLASHQLRTPIAGMKWSIELLQIDDADRLTDRQHKYLNRLMMSIKRMSVLVDDFLRVSRFELGTLQAEPTVVNLPEIFEELLAEQVVRVRQKNLHIKTFYDQSLQMVWIDSNLLRMIVGNLYSNATKYTKEKGTIHIGYGQKDNTIVITVADNGMGIPTEDQDEIFSKLFRASNAIRNVPDGTGLGLYIAKQAVTVLQGSVTFTSAENMGTTFEVTLPLELPPDA